MLRRDSAGGFELVYFSAPPQDLLESHANEEKGIKFKSKKGQKAKGVIRLAECDQVDGGLTFDYGKHKLDYVFDVKTPRRIYYLAAQSLQDMNTWVRLVCNACGLRQQGQVDQQENGERKKACLFKRVLHH